MTHVMAFNFREVFMIGLRRYQFRLLSSTILLLTTTSTSQQLTEGGLLKRLQGLPFTTPAISLPQIPSGDYSIVSFGAIADGMTKNTKAFADAIAAVSAKGGGRVVVPAGHWLTGPIRLESNIELHLETGALVVFSPDFDDYPIVARPGSSTYKAHPPLWAVQAKNIAITGSGTFNGNGQAWRMVKKDKMNERQWRDLVRSGGSVTEDGKIWFPSQAARDGEQYLREMRKRIKKPTATDYAPAREYLRPNMAEFYDCEGVLVEGVTFTNAPAWTLSPVQCDNVVIHRVTIVNPWWAQNADGIDLNATRNVLVNECTVDTGDDAICIKPGTAPKKRRDQPSCENIIVTDCTVYHGHGGFVIGSESYGGGRNFFGRNLTFIGTDIGLRFKSVPGRGGLIEGVYLQDIRMKDIVDEAISFDMSYGGDATIDVSDTSRVPHFRNFEFKDISCDGAARPLIVLGLDELPVEQIVIDGLRVRSTEGIQLNDATTFTMRNVRLSVSKGPAISATNARDIVVDGLTLEQEVSVLVNVAGTESRGIDVRNVTGAGYRTRVQAQAGADEDAVTLK